MGLLTQFFNDSRAGDWAPDDGFLDYHFSRLEQVSGLAGIPHAGRVPFDKIIGSPSFVDYSAGWQVRGAPVMAPIGMLWHWTAGKPTPARPSPSLSLCIAGRADIPGPLCQLHIGWDGHLTVIASGRANHAGIGHQALLQRIAKGLPPQGSARALKLGNTGGSGGSLIGVEIEHPGDKTPFTQPQLFTIGAVSRRVRTFYGWTEAQAIMWHHKAWTDRKIDLDETKLAAMLAAHRIAK